jgi:hypothetical protein
MVGEKRLDASSGHELSAEGCRVEELTIGVAMPLHLPILVDPRANREHRLALFSTVS